jgi:ATP-dependent Clp protease protease subunit
MLLDTIKFDNLVDRMFAESLILHRTINLFEGVDENTSEMVIKYLQFLENLDSTKPITLLISSPGGECYAGLAIYDAIKSCKCPVSTVATGLAMSMGSVILAAGTPGLRKAHKNCTIMLHEPSGFVIGRSSEAENSVKELKRIKNLMSDIYLETSGGKLTKRKLKEIFTKDSYMTSEEALELGLIDSII